LRSRPFFGGLRQSARVGGTADIVARLLLKRSGTAMREEGGPFYFVLDERVAWVGEGAHRTGEKKEVMGSGGFLP